MSITQAAKRALTKINITQALEHTRVALERLEVVRGRFLLGVAVMSRAEYDLIEERLLKTEKLLRILEKTNNEGTI